MKNNIVGIYDEEGIIVNNSTYEVISMSTGTKNIVRIKECKTGEIRLIHKDRVFLLDRNNEEGSLKLDKKNEDATEQTEASVPKKKAKKKPMIEFNLKELEDKGIVFRSKENKSMEAGGTTITIESFCLVSTDGTKWKHFNLYNSSLGKKAKPPEFGGNDNVKHELSGNVDAIGKYLEKKGYDKV